MGDNKFRSISGLAMPTAEPAGEGDAVGNTSEQRPDVAQKRSPSQQRAASSASTPVPQLRKQPSSSLLPSSSSAGASPQGSRNVSPIRKEGRPQPLTTPIATQPSAAAIQRALSATNVPQLPSGPVTDAVSRLPRATGKSGGGSGDNTPQWPISPRLKSPPPSATSSRRNSAQMPQRKGEGTAAPSINVQSPTPLVSTPPPKTGNDESRRPEQQLQTPAKAPSRGPSGKSTLETVQENSSDSIPEPLAATQAAADLKPLSKITEEEKTNGTRDDVEKHTQPGESGSESAGSKADRGRGRRQSLGQPTKSAQRPSNSNNNKNSYPSSLTSAKSRQPEAKQNMTVETETVASIPQSALNAGDRNSSGRNEHSGTIRLKPSTETIRPKKERKKTSQKSRSINQGTTSSKADLFEARVANAVDEANTSDSDETFVYESNPPEPQRRPRHHSRTPSVTSAHSTAEQPRGGVRNFGDMMDERRVAGKRSMKFSNNPFNDVDSPDSKGGTVRSQHSRHYSKYARGASMAEQDSPYTQASKLRANHLNARHSRPNTPRSPQSGQRTPTNLFGRKQEHMFDFDGEGADDERTPLVGTVRTPRSVRHARRGNSDSVRSIDEFYGVRQRSRCGRLGGCLLGFCVFAAVILSAVAFLVMSNRPMYDVRIRKIQNVLASEQEIMLDLLVGAVNPNALGITVTDMDVNIFAKSSHVGSGANKTLLTASESDHVRRRRRLPSEQQPSADEANPNPWQDLTGHWHAPDGGVDRGTDPMPPEDGDDDIEKDAQTMLLGRILHFDQGLTFEGSPIKRHLHYSVGELRLMKPGNKTEAGGSARWEHVLEHPFELIIRGVLRYQLPISMRLQSVSVSASCLVHPEDGVDKAGNMRIEPVDHSDHWQWIDPDDLHDYPSEAFEEGRIVEVEDG